MLTDVTFERPAGEKHRNASSHCGLNSRSIICGAVPLALYGAAITSPRRADAWYRPGKRIQGAEIPLGHAKS